MSLPAKPKIHQEPDDVPVAEQDCQPSGTKASRRDLFWGGLGFGALVKACGNRVGLDGENKRGPEIEVVEEPEISVDPAQPPEPVAEPMPMDQPIESDEITAQINEISSEDEPYPDDMTELEPTDCSPLGADFMDTSVIPLTDLSLQFRFYEGHSTWMIAFGIAEYSPDNPKRVTHYSLLRSSGQMVATDFLSNADIRPDGKLRPFVFEGINLRGETSFVLVFSHADGTQSKFEAVEGFVRPETHFEDSDFVRLSAGEVHSRFYLNQAMGNFNHSKRAGYKAAEGASFSFTGRSLMTMQQDVTPVAAVGLRGFILTDLLGKELEPGTSFTDIVEHQNLVCYKNEEGTWFRTIIKVG